MHCGLCTMYCTLCTVVSYPLCAMCCCTVHCLLRTVLCVFRRAGVRCELCAEGFALCAVIYVLCTVHSVLCAVNCAVCCECPGATVCAVHYVQWTVHSVLTVQCAVCLLARRSALSRRNTNHTDTSFRRQVKVGGGYASGRWRLGKSRKKYKLDPAEHG
jgi:hypothetical protein